MTKIKFSFYAEKKNQATGKSSWNKTYTSPEVFLESISITTAANLQKVEDVVIPLVYPMGVMDRICEIAGTFAESLELDDGLNYNLDVIQDAQNESLGRAIKVTSGNTLVPELGTAYWVIRTFKWDREARKSGQYHFTMTLGYVWDPSLSEIQLFSSGTCELKYDNVRFYIDDYPIYAVNIHCGVKELNTAKFKSVERIWAEDDQIKIYCSTYPQKPCFYGIVQETPNASDGTFEYTCIEIGDILKRKMIAKIGTGLFKTRVIIPNPFKKNYFTIQQMVQLILAFYNTGKLYNYDPGVGVCNEPTLASSKKIPGRAVWLPPQMFSGKSIAMALEDFLMKQCGLYTWYDSASGKLGYGFLRDAISLDSQKEFIEMTKRTHSYQADYETDYIVLWDNTGGHCAKAGTISDSGRCIQFKLNSNLTDQSLKEFAVRIKSDITESRDTYQVTFQAGTVRFQEGDYFTGLGDETTTVEMLYRSGADIDPTETPGNSVWQIKEITITETSTEVIVGSSYFSVFDVYQDELKRVDGVPATTETKDIDSSRMAAGVSATVIT